jgi:hypothetical protein
MVERERIMGKDSDAVSRDKKRGLIERVFGKLKENRRLAVRYEKSDINFLGFIFIAFLKIFFF